MPLKLAKFDANNLSVINGWADQHENQVQSHTKQLASLNLFIENLFKQNPTLIRPSNPKQSK